MIVLDTHIWIWWVHGDPQLPPTYLTYIQAHEPQGIGISAISCWEVAKLVEYNRLTLPLPVGDWLDQALIYPGVRLLELTPRIAVESTQLPGMVHRDPADHFIAASAKVFGLTLVTADPRLIDGGQVLKKILNRLRIRFAEYLIDCAPVGVEFDNNRTGERDLGEDEASG